MDLAHRQRAYRLRVDGGLQGARGVDVAVVVDVLSFTTTLSVALDVGTAVLPHRGDESAAALARERNALLAVGRSQARCGDISLSPATLRVGAAPARLVLPSPNGSTIAAHLGTAASTCLWGAGAVVDHFALGGWPASSPEAGAARAAWRAILGTSLEALLDCASGSELVARGYRADVVIVAEVDSSRAVPLLQGDVFAPAPEVAPRGRS